MEKLEQIISNLRAAVILSTAINLILLVVFGAILIALFPRLIEKAVDDGYQAALYGAAVNIQK